MFLSFPHTQVKDLTALLQHEHSYFEGETGEKGERQTMLYKKAQDNESARVSKDVIFTPDPT